MPSNTVTIGGANDIIYYTIGVSGQLVIDFSDLFNVYDSSGLCSQAYDLIDMEIYDPLPPFITK